MYIVRGSDDTQKSNNHVFWCWHASYLQIIIKSLYAFVYPSCTTKIITATCTLQTSLGWLLQVCLKIQSTLLSGAWKGLQISQKAGFSHLYVIWGWHLTFWHSTADNSSHFIILSPHSWGLLSPFNVGDWGRVALFIPKVNFCEHAPWSLLNSWAFWLGAEIDLQRSHGSWVAERG